MDAHRRPFAALAILALVGSAVAALAAPAEAAVATEWRAVLDRAAQPSAIVVRGLATGETYVHGQVSGLAPGVRQAVAVRRGSCASPGALVMTLPAVRARADRQAVWTRRLTAAQAIALRAATAGAARVSVRVGARCGALVRSTLRPSAAHRIGVRTVARTAEFYDRATGQRWVPRGSNYIRLAPQAQIGGSTVTTHSTFNTDRYDPVAAGEALARMQADGYNAVRVWLSDCCAGGLADPATNGLAAGYLDDFIDFLERARAHGIQVMPTLDWLPAVHRYDDLVDSTCGTDFGVANCHFMAPGGLAANALFFRDLIAALRARGAPLDAVWAWQLRNELAFDSDQAPLTFTSGKVTAANGRTYDMAAPTDHERIMDESLAWYIDRSRAAIRAVDPTALVSVGFFVPQEPNPARLGDTRVIDTRPAYTSTADFVDLHAYPGLDLTLDQLAQNYAIAAVPPTKPVIFGEMGAFRFAYPTAASGADGIAGWQIGSCALGVDGWLTWTWDLTPDTAIYPALEESGTIEKALAPATRPDPCAWGGIAHDLAHGAPVTASGSLPDEPPADAVDQNGFTKWGSGGFPPQWIQVEFPGPATIAQILLHVSQYPATGDTVHHVYGRVGAQWREIDVAAASTRDSQWLVLAPPHPGAWTGISAVRVETTSSPSWVAWWDLEVIGTLES